MHLSKGDYLSKCFHMISPNITFKGSSVAYRYCVYLHLVNRNISISINSKTKDPKQETCRLAVLGIYCVKYESSVDQHAIQDSFIFGFFVIDQFSFPFNDTRGTHYFHGSLILAKQLMVQRLPHWIVNQWFQVQVYVQRGVSSIMLISLC